MDPFIGQIMMFGGNFAPRGWALCDGQLLAISSNTALFSIIGTTYGGDGRTTFALPDLRGRASIHPGNGPGLSAYRLGERGGVEDVTLSSRQIPSHNHAVSGDVPVSLALRSQADLKVSSASADEEEPSSSAYLAAGKDSSGNAVEMFTESAPDTTLAAGSVTVSTTGTGKMTLNTITNNTGGNLSHTNIEPYLCVNYIIALVGIFPSRS